MDDYPITAGTIDEISLYTGEWMIIDIGLSQTNATTGIWNSPNRLYTITYGELLPEVIKRACVSGQGQLNLAIEAPLSVAFGNDGNPRTRPCDIWRQPGTLDTTDRNWYQQAGPDTLLMAQFLLHGLHQSDERRRRIKLFEAHVSFKGDSPTNQFPEAGGNTHLADVLAVRAKIENNRQTDIFTEGQLRRNADTDENLIIRSPFPFLDPELIPPVIRVTPQ